MKRTNASKHTKFATLMAGAALLGLVSQSALALGTAAGATVSNLATLSYAVGGVTQTPIGSSATGNTTGAGTPTDFVVDNKANVLVTTQDVTFVSVVPGQTAAVTKFLVNNLGNSTQDVLLTAADVAAGQTLFGVTDNFVPTAITIYADTNNNGIYDAGTDLATTFVDELAANATATIFVVMNVPVAQINNDAALVSLTGQVAAGGTAATAGAALVNAVANTAGVDVVLADAANAASATAPANTAMDGLSIAQSAIKVVSAIISVAKTTAVLCDPFNGSTNPKNIPGSVVQYAITITNTGAANATLNQVTDTLNAALAFEPTLISGAGAGANCASGTGSLSATGFGAVAGAGATTYAAPGLAAQAVTAGTAVVGQNITINYGTLVSPATAVLVGGVLPAGDFVTVYFNTVVQ